VAVASSSVSMTSMPLRINPSFTARAGFLSKE
jgi:hypothetical protein